MPTLKQYENMLGINKLRLDDELEIQAQLQHDIGVEVARLNTKVIEAKDKLARVEGEVLDRIKERDSKTTVDQAKARMLSDPKRLQEWSVYQQLRETLEMWQSLHAAWITKGYKMGDIAALFGADYFAVTSVSGSGNRSEVRAPRASDFPAEPTRADVDRRSAVREATASRDSDEDSPRRRRAL